MLSATSPSVYTCISMDFFTSLTAMCVGVLTGGGYGCALYGLNTLQIKCCHEAYHGLLHMLFQWLCSMDPSSGHCAYLHIHISSTHVFGILGSI